MGLFDFLRDPASLWVAESGLKLELDLQAPSFCGVLLGARATSLSKLGPPSNSGPMKKGSYSWAPLGFAASATKGILDYFCVTINPLDWDGMKPYQGVFLRGGKALDLGPTSRMEDVVRVLGEPWHVYAEDEDDEVTRTIFYETRMLEWEIEFLKAGPLHSLGLITPPSMSNPQSRKYVECEKPWPPE
jgi:hypothetical protein